MGESVVGSGARLLEALVKILCDHSDIDVR
jgi:hypothetical protein